MIRLFIMSAVLLLSAGTTIGDASNRTKRSPKKKEEDISIHTKRRFETVRHGIVESNEKMAGQIVSLLAKSLANGATQEEIRGLGWALEKYMIAVKQFTEE